MNQRAEVRPGRAVRWPFSDGRQQHYVPFPIGVQVNPAPNGGAYQQQAGGDRILAAVPVVTIPS